MIDPTFNCKAYINNKDIKFHKFVTVQIYSKFLNKCPKVKNVGDIIRLRRFQFCLSPKGELIGYQNQFSNWLIYRGDKKGCSKPTSYMDIAKNQNRACTKYEERRIEELREWSQSFFSGNKIKYITWWTPLIEPTEETIEANHVISDVDLILRTERVDKEKNTVEFVDQNKKNYTLSLQVTPVLTKGEVIKLRCINM